MVHLKKFGIIVSKIPIVIVTTPANTTSAAAIPKGDFSRWAAGSPHTVAVRPVIIKGMNFNPAYMSVLLAGGNDTPDLLHQPQFGLTLFQAFRDGYLRVEGKGYPAAI